MKKYNWKYLTVSCLIALCLTISSTTAEESSPEQSTETSATEQTSQSSKPPVFSTWLKRTLGIKSSKYEVVDTSKPEEEFVEEEVAETEEPKKERKSFVDSLKSIFKKSDSEKVAEAEPETTPDAKETSKEAASEVKEEASEVAAKEEPKKERKSFVDSLKSIFKKSDSEKVAEAEPETTPKAKEAVSEVKEVAAPKEETKAMPPKEGSTEVAEKEEPKKEEVEDTVAKAEDPKKEKKSFTESLKSIFKRSDAKKSEPQKETTVAESSKSEKSDRKGFSNPFRNFWGKKSETDHKKSASISKQESSHFHDPKQLAKPEYVEPADKEAALGVVGEVKGDKVGPFSRPGKYDLSGTETGLLLPINNKDELNTKDDIVSVIMKQPALMSVDSYSSLSIHKVISINEIILKRGRFRLKTLDKAGLWTIRGRETLLSLSENSDVIFDMTGTLITKIFVLSGEAHCLPKLGEKPIKVQAGQMVHSGLNEIKTTDISEEQKGFFDQRFSLTSEESLSEKLNAAGVFSSRSNKNWPMESKIYSGILCTNCSYAFDTRETYYDVCPVCHTSLLESPSSEDSDENLIHPAKNKSKPKKSYNWSNWFFGIKSKKSSK